MLKKWAIYYISDLVLYIVSHCTYIWSYTTESLHLYKKCIPNQSRFYDYNINLNVLQHLSRIEARFSSNDHTSKTWTRRAR